ncbi:glycosyltransferase family 4 protein [Arthrobacter sp. KK5.5]|uniref:glycosyltransferase family 4 protein n=1 Tax=Arthrobacter sp. KK5.5 TaxID=3373084 RepID=UPI003EE7C12F
MAFTSRLWVRKATPRWEKWLHGIDALMAIAPGTPIAAMTALLVGNVEILEHRLTLALAKGPRGKRAKQLADIALAGDHPQFAATFASRMETGAQGVDITWAKLHWYNGQSTEAIQRLDANNPRTLRIRERFVAEQAVYGDWRPTVDRVDRYVPRDNVVLHLLTNSLPHTRTGYTQRSHSLLRAQCEVGWEVHAVTRLGYPETLGIIRPDRLQTLDGVRYHRLYPNHGINNLRDRLQEETEHLLRLVLEVRPSVLHTTTHFVNGLVVRAVAEATGLPWIYEVRGQLSDTWVSKRSPAAAGTERYRQFNKRETEVMSAADLVLTLGHTMRNRIIDFGIDPGRVLLSPNAVGEEFLDTPSPSRVARVELGLDPNLLHIGTVSSLVAYEGIDDLVSAFAILRRERNDVRLMVIGDGAALPALRLQASALGLDPDDIFPGRVDASEAPRYHRALDVFVVPRKDFAVTRSVTPLKPVEAMASCRPVVASDLPALREMVVPGINGLCVPPGDPAALAAAIGQLLDDGELRANMGFAGRAMVLKSRTWQRNAEQCIEHYGVLRRGKAPSR